jgi:hypothetical protein
LESCRFFYAGHVEQLVLDCYQLAKFYAVDPDVFLDKPVSVIRRHMKWTAKLTEVMYPKKLDKD